MEDLSNAQTFRIATELGEYSEKYGLNLTRRVLLGIVKYPVFYDEVVNKDNIKPPKCLYSEQKEIFDWLIEYFSDEDKELFQSTEQENDKHKKSKYKTLDASIMDMADDIAYAMHDFEDAIKTKIINKQVWDEFIDDDKGLKSHITLINRKINQIDSKNFIDFATERLFDEDNKKSKIIFSKLIHFFITNIKVNENNKFKESLLKYNIEMDEQCKKILETIKNFVSEKVIKRTENTQLEFKGKKIIGELYDAITKSPRELLPKIEYGRYKQANNKEKFRVIADYIAGMTDTYAAKLYKRLFDASYGSTMDMI